MTTKTIYGYSEEGDKTMGYIKRNKTGNYNAGTKLIIPGKGIQTFKKPQGNKKSDK